MASFSHSQIGTYETCPLQYKYAYIDKIRVEVETVEAFLGSRVHETLEKLYKDLRYQRLMKLEELQAYFNKKWKENWKDSILIVKKEYDQENYRKMGEKYLADYYRRYQPFDQGRISGLETRELLSLDENRNYSYHIRIDRLMDMGEGLYEVHDYKTSLTLAKQEELDGDKQLAMYSLWVMKNFKDCRKVRLVWHYLAFDKELDSYRTEEQLESLRKEILEKIKRIEKASEFPANVSSLCDWCSYKAICPMWKHAAELEQKPEKEYLDDQGLKLVDEYVRIKEESDQRRVEAEQRLEELKEELIAFCQRKGISVVFGSENKVAVNEYESLKLPAKNTREREELVSLLKNIGKLDKVTDLDIFALARVLKNREWDEKDLVLLQEFATKEKGYRLSVSKK
jgi:putative RecB family exonuclease